MIHARILILYREISAQELANPLFMPSTFGHWDEPCPSAHSFGMFISRMWEQNPDITPEMVHGAIKHFTSMMEPELKTQCQVDVTNSFAYGMMCMSVHGTPSFASYEKILSSIHHYDEVQSLFGGLDEKIGWTPTGIVSWRVENAQSTNKPPCQIHKPQFQNSRKQKGSLQFPIPSTMHSSHRQLMERSCTLEQGLSSSWNDIVFQSSGWYRQLVDSYYNPGVEAEIVNRLRYLIYLGLDINVQDVAGRTPLHKLLMLGHNVRTATRIRIRILAGADPTIIDSHSWPPLFYGIVFGHIPALVQLLNTTSNTDAVLHKARLLAHATLNAARNAPTDTSIAINDTEWQKWSQWMCSTLDIPIPWQDFRKARGVSKALLIRQYQCVVDIVQYFIDYSHVKADEELENFLWNMDAGNPDVMLDTPNDDILHRLEALLRRRLDNPCPTSSGKPTKDNGTTSMDEKQEQSNAEGFSFMVAVSFSTNVFLMVMLGCILPAFV